MKDSRQKEHHQSDKPSIKQKAGLSFFQFVIVASIASGTPFGMEYAVYAFGVQWTLIGIVLLALCLSLPVALISSELIALMPTNHGQIAWAYRAFHHFGPKIGDFVGYINAANLLIYYLVGWPMVVIIFAEYLSTAIDPLSQGGLYLIKLGVIIIAFILNVFKINIVGSVVDWFICISMAPFFIGFFWKLPDIQISQWTVPCDNYDLAFFFSSMAFLASGYESMGQLGGELKFEPKTLMIALCLAVLISATLMIVPIITAATASYDDCSSWYDGYFGVVYGEIWTPLYYSLLMGALFSNFAFLVIGFALSARVIWAMSQRFILLLDDGTMVLDVEMYTTGIEMSGVNEIDDNVKRIPLGILPKKCGMIWEKTGSPLVGLIIFTVWSSVVCSFMSYEMVMEFSFFMYAITLVFVILSFLIMKHYEPNAPRWFEVPFGKVGAWLLSLLSLGIITLIFCFCVVGFWIGIVVTLGFNILFIGYYFTIKKRLDKIHEYVPIVDKYSDDPDMDDDALM